jgi:hypothetical protein
MESLLVHLVAVDEFDVSQGFDAFAADGFWVSCEHTDGESLVMD